MRKNHKLLGCWILDIFDHCSVPSISNPTTVLHPPLTCYSSTFLIRKLVFPQCMLQFIKKINPSACVTTDGNYLCRQTCQCPLKDTSIQVNWQEVFELKVAMWRTVWWQPTKLKKKCFRNVALYEAQWKKSVWLKFLQSNCILLGVQPGRLKAYLIFVTHATHKYQVYSSYR